MTAQSGRKALPATLQKMRVQCLEVSEHGDRHEEVPPRIPNEPLDLALVVTLARAAKPVREQVVRLQLAEHTQSSLRRLRKLVCADVCHCRECGQPRSWCCHRGSTAARRRRTRTLARARRRTLPSSPPGSPQRRSRRSAAGIAKKWILRSTPPITPIASPKSAWAERAKGSPTATSGAIDKPRAFKS